MMRRSPLNPKRTTPRRNEGRVKHSRMRPKASADPTAEQKRYHDWLRHGPVTRCECGCGRDGECLHHLLSTAPGKQGRRDHWFVVRLAHHCHNGASDSVHGLGSEALFRDRHGVDLVAVACQRLKEYRDAQ